MTFFSPAFNDDVEWNENFSTISVLFVAKIKVSRATMRFFLVKREGPIRSSGGYDKIAAKISNSK